MMITMKNLLVSEFFRVCEVLQIKLAKFCAIAYNATRQNPMAHQGERERSAAESRRFGAGLPLVSAGLRVQVQKTPENFLSNEF
jgi:hypothetical protein